MRLIQTLLAGDSCSYIIFVLSFMMIIFIIRLDTPLKVEIEKKFTPLPFKLISLNLNIMGTAKCAVVLY